MAKKKVEGGTEAEVQGAEAPKKAYEGGEVVYWLQGEVSNDDYTLIRNAKRVFNEQTIPHVENDPSAVANIKYAMMTGAPAAPQREEVNPAAGAGAEVYLVLLKLVVVSFLLLRRLPLKVTKVNVLILLNVLLLVKLLATKNHPNKVIYLHSTPLRGRV